MVWNERRRFDIGSHVRPIFQAAAGGFPHLAPRLGSILDHRTFWLRASCAIVITCQMENFLLGQDCLIETVRTAATTCGGGPTFPKFRWSGAGVVRILGAHECAHE